MKRQIQIPDEYTPYLFNKEKRLHKHNPVIHKANNNAKQWQISQQCRNMSHKFSETKNVIV
jgi:hypothetical protein